MFKLNARTIVIAAAIAKLAALAVPAYAQSSEVASNPNLEEIIVQGYRDRSYQATDSSTATLFSMPLEETPFNIGVITERLIDDLQINTLRDSVLLNASVQRTHSHTNNATGFNIRGFAINADQLGFLVNGIPVAAFDAPPAHVSALDRIEIIKGTSALYYGAGEPAGVINYAYKTPQAEARVAVQATYGEHGERRAELDATGALGSDKLMYRFTLGWQDSETNIDYDYAEDLAPTLQLLWKPSENTDVRFIGEYIEHEGNPLSQDLFYLNDDYVDTPDDT
ncbi:MAG: TonB-dependent receptor plug domain-containing protein, partial [Pseudomonadota bacterium]